jgi:ABC-type branched-subunit amino acid transport system substrate-binding protein
MILVQNRRQLLSGSSFFLAGAFLAFLSGCSPKTTPPVKRPDKPGELPKQEQPKIIELKPRLNSISLILPFNLDNVDPEKATSQEISKSEIAIDFYQGFKLALDSLKNRGYHFKLEVFDAQNDEAKTANLARTPSVTDNDLIVGPVFPDNIKVFSDLAKLEDKLQISPLAASMPSQFNNPHLVTINNTIDQHGWKVADYIIRHYPATSTQIVLINTRDADSEKFAAPVRNYLNSLSENKLKIIEVTNSKGIESILVKNKNNVVIIANEDQSFIVPTINRLYTLKTRNSYKIDVFGHPDWVKTTIDINQLQRLNTKVTSSYTIDYESEAVKNFVSRFQAEYKLDPSEYAFKGFDTGYYFGLLLGEFGKDYLKNLTVPYEGLHNNFRFSYDAATGFRNTELKLLKYEDYELRPVK